jgi:S-adenosylmethionine:tRNA ribosyltransferase-isomerase
MKVDLFDFDLPPDRIALRPARPRGSARLLVANNGVCDNLKVGDLADLLRPGDIMVFNNTRVIPGRLKGRRGTAGVEATLLKAIGPDTWHALARPARKLKSGDRVNFKADLNAEVVENQGGGQVVLRFDVAGDDLRAALEEAGDMPLPPYIAGRRAPDAHDREDYQTVFGREEGAVAAPTAGLHVTEEFVSELDARGIGHTEITLHVGAGTFLPVKTEDTDDHPMHVETGYISDQAAQAINGARAAGGRAVAVGTTALRLLEAAADDAGSIQAFDGETDLFITPGYRFKAVDLLLSNFHLPRSTLFMLVCAFAGTETMKAAYQHAVDAGYRFYSYGDATLLYPDTSL